MDTKDFRFSASSVKSWIQCGTKFKFEKVDKIKPTIEVGHARWLGKLVHASIYQSVGKLDPESGFKSWEIIRDEPNELASLQLFQDLWVGGVDERTKSIYELEVGSSIPTGRFMKKRKVSALNNDDQTELASAWKEVAREMVKNGVSSLRELKLLELEKSVAFKFLERDFAGFLDVIAIEKDTGKIVFADFKTVWDKPVPAKLQDDPQFVLYSFALKDALGLDYYPDGFFVHLRSGTMVRFTMSDGVLAKMEKKIASVFSNLEDDIYFHNPGVLCGYCDFQNICPQ